eukprot:maker-scaffold208_size258758-snap-gene-1.31 protein:Tk04205 transcript:maker-scaffold208_size258758-snap-gene-1.31-mRNA-1 annotation:"fatty acid binding protein"
MSEENDSSQDPVDDGEDEVYAHVLLILGHGSSYERGESQSESEEKGAQHICPRNQDSSKQLSLRPANSCPYLGRNVLKNNNGAAKKSHSLAQIWNNWPKSPIGQNSAPRAMVKVVMEGQSNGDKVYLIEPEVEPTEEPTRLLREPPVKYNASARRKIMYLAIGGVLVTVSLCLIVLEGQSLKRSDPLPTYEGRYVLESFGSNFNDYLESLRIPQYLFRMIRNLTEVVELKPPSDLREGIWLMKFSTEFAEHTLKFQLDRSFNVTYHTDNNSVSHLCTMPSQFTLKCTTRDAKRGWNIVSNMLFSDTGFTNYVSNVDEKVTTSKSYRRLQPDEDVSLNSKTPEKSLSDLEDNMDGWE